MEARLTKQQAEDLRERLSSTVAQLTASQEEEKGRDLLRYRLTIAYFPLEAEPADPDAGETSKRRKNGGRRKR